MLFLYLQHIFSHLYIFWIHHRPCQRHMIWRAVRQIQIWSSHQPRPQTSQGFFVKSRKFWILKVGGIKLFFDVFSDIFKVVFCMYFIHQRIRISHEQFRFWSILFLDVFMKIIHQSFWDIKDWHPKINWLVENKVRLFSCALQKDLHWRLSFVHNSVSKQAFQLIYHPLGVGYPPCFECSPWFFQTPNCSWVWRNLSQTRWKLLFEASCSARCKVSTMHLRWMISHGEFSWDSSSSQDIVWDSGDGEHTCLSFVKLE